MDRIAGNTRRRLELFPLVSILISLAAVLSYVNYRYIKLPAGGPGRFSNLAVLRGLKDDQALRDYQIVYFQPVDPVNLRTEAAVKVEDIKVFKVTKDAPQVILALAANAEQDWLQAERENRKKQHTQCVILERYR